MADDTERRCSVRMAGIACALVLAVAAVWSGSSAYAAPGKSTIGARPAPSALAGNLPATNRTGPSGYAMVSNGPLVATNGTQSHGTATCPIGTVPLGGGMGTTTVGFGVYINSSYPAGVGWAVDVNNTIGSDATFTVYAVFAAQPANYVVVESAAVGNPAGSQSRATAVCPKGTAVYGGGPFSNASSTSVDVNSTWPVTAGTSYEWSTDMNNASGTLSTVTAYAVCGKKLPKYGIVTFATIDNPAGAETATSATCAGHAVPLGGGAFSSSGSVQVNLGSTFPHAPGYWTDYIDNVILSDASVTAYSVCAI